MSDLRIDGALAGRLMDRWALVRRSSRIDGWLTGIRVHLERDSPLASRASGAEDSAPGRGQQATRRVLVNAGGTPEKLPGFINISDGPGGDLRADLAHLPFPSNSIHGIYCGQAIERLSRAGAMRFLRECRRVLVPNGRLRLAVSDLDQVARGYFGDWRGQARLQDLDHEGIATRCEFLNLALREGGRQWVYSEDELARLAGYAGLSRPRRWRPGASDNRAFRGLESLPDSTLVLEVSKHRPADSDGEPLVSVLMPVYHEMHFEQALESALGQTYSHVEVIVGDDSPGREIEMVVERHRRHGHPIRYFKNRSRLGPHPNHLKCFALARGEYIKFLHDDDALHPSCVERMVGCLRTHADVILVTSHRQCIDAEGTFLPDINHTYRPVVADSILDAVSLATSLLDTRLNLIGEPSTAMFRKRDLADTRPHILSFAGRPCAWNVDITMWLTLLSQGDAIYLVDSMSYFRIHADQQSQGPEAFRQGNLDWERQKADAARLGLYDPRASGAMVARPL